MWYFTVLITALGLVMGGAHVLEFPARLQYDDQLYMRVTSTMYLYFGLVGGPIQVLSLILAAVLAWRVRGRPTFRPALVGTLCLAASLGFWLGLVQPVNARWGEALAAGPPAAAEAYATLRGQWEFGHSVAFLAWLVGFAVLLHGLVRESAETIDVA